MVQKHKNMVFSKKRAVKRSTKKRMLGLSRRARFRLYTVFGVLFVAAVTSTLLKFTQGNAQADTAAISAQVKTAQQAQTTSTAATTAATKNAATTKQQSATGAGSSSAQNTPPSSSVAPAATPPVVSYAKASWTSKSLYVDPYNAATAYANANPGADASYIAREGQQPVAQWFGEWSGNVTTAINSYVGRANAAGGVPVIVLYNIPNRDCGGYSSGGQSSSAAYLQWVRQAASGIAGRSTVVILEPDALAGADCLSAAGKQDRYTMISQAVGILKAQPNAAVYIDAGNPNWQSADTMAARLNASNIAAADGFSLNVSNFIATSSNVSYGEKISQLVGGKHYVIDTSRSGGNVQTSKPYNVPNAALGQMPTTRTTGHADGYLWIKVPWESDGPVNGGPSAGQPYWSYAVQLAKNAGW